MHAGEKTQTHELQEKMKHERHESAGGKDHGNHHVHMLEDFRKRFIVSFILTFPVLILSPTIQDFFGFELHFPGADFITFLSSSVVYFYGGYPFLKGIKEELAAKSPGMMTLIAIAISVAYFYSSAVVFGLPGGVFFWELVTLIDVMLLGHWLEMRSVMGASRALEELVKIMPSIAHLKKDGEIVDVGVDKLKVGDNVLIKPGEKVPVDGTVVEGTSRVNESMLTGESKPVTKKPGEEVIGGSINGDSIFCSEGGKNRKGYLSQSGCRTRQSRSGKQVKNPGPCKQGCTVPYNHSSYRGNSHLSALDFCRQATCLCSGKGSYCDGNYLSSCPWACNSSGGRSFNVHCRKIRTSHQGQAGI